MGDSKTTLWESVKSTLQISHGYHTRPAGLRWRSSTLFIVATVAFALFTDLFLYGLVVPILPYMLQDRVGLPDEQVQSHVSGLLAAYAGASVLFSPVAGIVADKTSTRQLPFLLGLAALLGATVLLFLGQSIAVLAVARVLQGISAAAVWTIGLALCLDTVGPKDLGKTIGTIYSFASVGSLLSPFIGGVLYDKTGYSGVFGIAAALLGLDFTMRVLVIEKKVAKRYEADYLDTECLRNTSDDQVADQTDEHEGGQGASHSSDEEQSTTPDDGDGEFKLAAHQSKLARKLPIVPCLKHPSLLIALLVAFVQATILGSFDATIPTVARDLFHFDSLKSGILFLPLGGFDFIIGPLAGWFVDRYGTKPGAVIGYLYLVPVLTLLRLPHAGGKDQILLYGGLLALCGIGLAMIGAPSLVEAGIVVQQYYEANPDFFGEQGPYAQLYGLSSMVFSLGLTVGPELAGSLKDAIGYGNMNIVLAAISFTIAILCFIWLGGKPSILKRRGR